MRPARKVATTRANKTIRTAGQLQGDGMKQQGTLLLVDDDRHVLSSMADWLCDQGYPTDTAVGVHEAMAAIDQKAYDLVLADIRLGDGDGFDILVHCRENHPGTTVIMITG